MPLLSAKEFANLFPNLPEKSAAVIASQFLKLLEIEGVVKVVGKTKPPKGKPGAIYDIPDVITLRLPQTQAPLRPQYVDLSAPVAQEVAEVEDVQESFTSPEDESPLCYCLDCGASDFVPKVSVTERADCSYGEVHQCPECESDYIYETPPDDLDYVSPVAPVDKTAVA